MNSIDITHQAPISRSEQSFVSEFVEILNSWSDELGGAHSSWGERVDYAAYRFAYAQDGTVFDPDNRAYQTDVLVYDENKDKTWIPRVIIECKYGSMTTHDLLVYGRKADAHRSIHPYIRYGFVVGGYSGGIPCRMLSHGNSFDFLAVMPSDHNGMGELKNVIATELNASRSLWSAYRHRRLPTGTKLIHRPLVMA